MLGSLLKALAAVAAVGALAVMVTAFVSWRPVPWPSEWTSGQRGAVVFGAFYLTVIITILLEQSRR